MTGFGITDLEKLISIIKEIDSKPQPLRWEVHSSHELNAIRESIETVIRPMLGCFSDMRNFYGVPICMNLDVPPLKLRIIMTDGTKKEFDYFKEVRTK